MGFQRENQDGPSYRRWKRKVSFEIELMRDRQAKSSFECEQCPACPDEKKKGQSFCRKCYFKLMPAMRTGLYMKFGDGYEAAFWRAMSALGFTVDRLGNDLMRNSNHIPRFGRS